MQTHVELNKINNIHKKCLAMGFIYCILGNAINPNGDAVVRCLEECEKNKRKIVYDQGLCLENCYTMRSGEHV